MTNYTKKLAIGTVLVFTTTLLGAFLGYLIRIILAKNLTVEEYGLFYAVFTFFLLFAAIKGIGLPAALSKHIPEFLVRKQFVKIKSSIIFVLIATTITSGMLALIFFLLSKFLTLNYFKAEAAYAIFLILIVYFFLTNFDDIFSRIFLGFQRSFLFSLSKILPNLIVLIFIVIFIKSFGLLTPALAYLIAAIIISLAFFFFVCKTFSLSKYKVAITKPLAKKLTIFGLVMILAGIGGTVIGYIDTLLLTYFRTLSEVGVYNAILPTALILSFFGQSLAAVLFPMISELHAKKLKDKLVNGLTIILKYSFVFILPIGLVLLVFPELFIKIFFSEKYLSGMLALQILVIGAIIYSVALIIAHAVSGLGHPKKVTFAILIAALVNVVGNILLIPYFGINGAAVATFLSYLIILILNSISLSKLIEIKIPWKAWIGTFIFGFVFILLIYFLKSLLILNVWLELILTVGIAGMVYLALSCWFKIISISEIKNITYSIISKTQKGSK